MNLVLSHDGGGRRHYLTDRPVHCGQQLRLRIAPNIWVWARYEANLSGEVCVTLHTEFGLVIPDSGTVLRWPEAGDESGYQKEIELKLAQNKVPPGLLSALQAKKFRYSTIRSVFYCMSPYADDYCYGVAGDGENGGYEWFVFKKGVLETSDCGYGSTEVALRDVLVKEEV